MRGWRGPQRLLCREDTGRIAVFDARSGTRWHSKELSVQASLIGRSVSRQRAAVAARHPAVAAVAVDEFPLGQVPVEHPTRVLASTPIGVRDGHPMTKGSPQAVGNLRLETTHLLVFPLRRSRKRRQELTVEDGVDEADTGPPAGYERL